MSQGTAKRREGLGGDRDWDSAGAWEGPATTKKGRAEDPPCRRFCLELFAIGQSPRKETLAGPPSGHPRLLKPLSRLASLRTADLLQDWSAVLTSLMIWAVFSG